MNHMTKYTRKPRNRKKYTPELETLIRENITKLHIDDLATLVGKSRRSLFMYLRENDYKVEDYWNLYDIHPAQFLNPNTPEVAYLLGLLWADGHIRRECSGIVIDNVRDDIEEIEWIFAKTGDWARTNMERKDKRPSSQLRTYNKVISDFLLENDYGIKSSASPYKILSKIPNNLQHYFYLGWLDGDGCICLYGKYKTTSIQMAGSREQDWSCFEKLCQKMGIPISIYRPKNKGGSTVNITSQDGQKLFLSYIYQNYENDKIGLPRKNKKAIEALEKINNRKISNTGFIGVTKNRDGRFYSKIKNGGEKNKNVKYLGFYDTPEEAALAYDIAAFERKGNLARTNFPIENYITELAPNKQEPVTQTPCSK
jgi:hypothetical protein